MEKTFQAGRIRSGRRSLSEMILPKKKIIVEIIASLFILLFLYTALSKSFNIGSTVGVLKKTPFFSGFPEATAWAVVMAEYVLAALLFFPRTRNAGLYGSLIMMAAFTLYIGYMKAFIPKLPCSCGGVISKMTWNQHLIFNIAFTGLALVAILLQRKLSNRKDQILESPPVVFT